MSTNPTFHSLDSFKTKKILKVENKEYTIYSLKTLEKSGHDVSKLPNSMKVLLENLLRYEDGNVVKKEDILALLEWIKTKKSTREIAFHVARVLMQDFTGVPAVVDLAAMRDAIKKLGGDSKKINPLTQVDLVIDHSVTVDTFGTANSFKENVQLEFERNNERYIFLKWGQNAFQNFRVVPPGTGICHQVNVEYLAKTVWTLNDGNITYAYPDTLVGTDSHTTMVNGLSVLGWGVGGIEAEAAMLGQSYSMLIPEVVGFKLTGKLKEGATATDLVLTCTQMLRKLGVVNKFVEYFGPGLDNLSLADRATVANMAPEYGATCGFFPVDNELLAYLELTGRPEHHIKLVEAYAKEQGMWRDSNEMAFTTTLDLDLSSVEPSMAGPKRPQDRITLSKAHSDFQKQLVDSFSVEALKTSKEASAVEIEGSKEKLGHGDVVIAAITSCTNTSNPSVMIGAGLVAKKAHEKGLKVKPWVKTSFAPGSQVVTDYMAKAGLQEHLDALGFNLVGYGCTTCIGNSGPLPTAVSKAIDKGNLVVAAVLSGNRNFEGRVNPQTKANYLASPPLCVAYALAGTMNIDIYKDPIGMGKDGKDVFLKDIWPTNKEIADAVNISVTNKMFNSRYENVFQGPTEWQKISTTKSETYSWDQASTYIQNPPYFEGMGKKPKDVADIKGAVPLAILGDSITTDHISPAGNIKKDSPAGKFLNDHKVDAKDFNSYGARRGNHEVMMRGTFANIRIKNEMVPGIEGGITKHIPTGETMPIYDASMKYQKAGTPLVIIAGKEYGTGSSRDWAAKGTLLLGVKAVISESFERIHRSNLIGMGIMPLQFIGTDRKTLKLDGTEKFDILGLTKMSSKSKLDCVITRANGKQETIQVQSRIDTEKELEYFKQGGILQYVLRNLI